MSSEYSSHLTAWLDDAKVRDVVAALDDEARSAEIFAFIGERRRQHQRDLETLWAAVNAARSERDESLRERDELHAEIERLRTAVAHLQHENGALRDAQRVSGPISRSVKRAVVAGRAATRAWR